MLPDAFDKTVTVIASHIISFFNSSYENKIMMLWHCFATWNPLITTHKTRLSYASPTVGVSPLIFDAEMSPHPSRRSVSFASRNDPSETASRVTSSDAHGVIFRSTPKALNTSDDSGFPTR